MPFCLYNKKNITRGLAALVRKILFCHSKKKFISSRQREISSLYITKYYLDVSIAKEMFFQ